MLVYARIGLGSALLDTHTDNIDSVRKGRVPGVLGVLGYLQTAAAEHHSTAHVRQSSAPFRYGRIDPLNNIKGVFGLYK